MSRVPAHLWRESQRAGEVCLRRVWILSQCGLGRSMQHQRGWISLVSLFAIFACCKGVVSGTHRSVSGAIVRLRAVGIPVLSISRGGEDVKTYNANVPDVSDHVKTR